MAETVALWNSYRERIKLFIPTNKVEMSFVLPFKGKHTNTYVHSLNQCVYNVYT